MIGTDFQTRAKIRDHCYWIIVKFLDKSSWFICVLSITCCWTVNAQSNQPSFPIAWVWDISTPNREAYLLGELHAFIGTTALPVDRTLAMEIYKRVDKIWVEPQQMALEFKLNDRFLSSKVGTATWSGITDALTDVLKLAKVTPATVKQLHDDQLISLNKKSAALAFYALSELSLIKYLKIASIPIKITPGLIFEIEKIEKLRKSNKLNYIESNTAVDEAWRNKCDNDSLAQQYVDESLKLFDPINYWASGNIQTLQYAFANVETTTQEILDLWSNIYPGSALMLKCNIIPRSQNWGPKILDIVKTKGPPVAFVVGIGHLGGSEGLLSLLKNNGNLNFHRIFVAPEKD